VLTRVVVVTTKVYSKKRMIISYHIDNILVERSPLKREWSLATT